MIFLILLLTINAIHCTLPITFHKFDNEANLIFVNRPNISIASSFKTIKIKIGMEEYLFNSVSLKESINNITSMCLQLSTNSNCKYFKHFMEQNINNTESLHGEKRRKRFWSEIYDYFFGDCYELNQETIDKIQHTDKENRNLTSNHITISNNTLLMQQTLLNDTTEIIKNITKRLHKLEENQIKLNITTNINNLIQLTMAATLELNKKSKNIINILYYGKTTEIIELIGIGNIKLLINETNKTLHFDEQFYSKDAIKIINSAYISTEFLNQVLFIEIKIPIKSKNSNNFRVFKIIPLPFKRGRGTLRIRSDNMNILNNTKSGDISIISDYVLDKCKKLSYDELICSSEEFSYATSSCETNIFLHQNTTSCSFEQIMAPSTITRLFHNIFYCIIDRAIKFTINCNEEQDFQFKHNIWFQLESGCSIKISNREFHSFKNIPSKEFNFKLHQISIPKISIEQILNKIINETEDLLLLDKFILSANLQYGNISERINSLYFDSSKEISKIQMTNIESKYYIFWIILGFIFCLIVIKVVLKYLLK